MSNTNKFTGKAGLYSKFRPDYPKQLIVDLITKNNIKKDSIAADIGAGTGRLTKMLLEHNLQVFAVEPNTEMRQTAVNQLAANQYFHAINGTAEHTTLPDNSVDFVTVAQAFHWFDHASFKNEANRILKENGKVAIISNVRNISAPLNQEIAKVYQKFCPNFVGFSNGLKDSKEVYDSFFMNGYTETVYDFPISHDKNSFIGRHLSASYALNASDTLFPNFVQELSDLFDKYSKNDFLKLPNDTKYRCGNVG